MKLNTQFLFAALTAVTLITPACGGDAGKKTEEKKTEKTEVKADGTKTEVKTEEKKTDEKPADKAADPAPATPPAAAADRRLLLRRPPPPLRLPATRRRAVEPFGTTNTKQERRGVHGHLASSI
jgi:hypothetical protein